MNYISLKRVVMWLILILMLMTFCFAALADEVTIAESNDDTSLVITLLDDLGVENGEIVTRQSCVRVESGDNLITVLPQRGDRVDIVPLFTQTTREQLLGVIRQFRNLVNAETNYKRTSSNVERLQEKKEEINIELDEIDRIIKVFTPG